MELSAPSETPPNVQLAWKHHGVRIATSSPGGEAWVLARGLFAGGYAAWWRLFVAPVRRLDPNVGFFFAAGGALNAFLLAAAANSWWPTIAIICLVLGGPLGALFVLACVSLAYGTWRAVVERMKVVVELSTDEVNAEVMWGSLTLLRKHWPTGRVTSASASGAAVVLHGSGGAVLWILPVEPAVATWMARTFNAVRERLESGEPPAPPAALRRVRETYSD